MKIITHHGCKSSSMVVYINAVSCDLSLSLVELNSSPGGRNEFFRRMASPSVCPASPGLRGDIQQRIQFFII
jgi:hypothetical protein